ncbi:Toxin RTX-I translocation ATP-binding protein [Planctomycetes bacterium Pan216]|uniref:Toxin RTX-I translocation ATP-binding protein n=1 Tax=Kolteria novifilia TaxID=2527975 RepID=A0A518BAG5_9BACT|nr:Toxin RTX-I translocation ATP-binding protein [Planctomycetes bacterium Pan216]
MIWPFRQRRRTPTIIVSDPKESGAAALTSLLAFHGRWVPLEEINAHYRSSRDAGSPKLLLEVARRQDLEGEAHQTDIEGLRRLPHPAIILWKFQSFVLLERITRRGVRINDPRSGPRKLSRSEFERGYCGIALLLRPGRGFQTRGQAPSLAVSLASRLKGSQGSVLLIVLASLLLIVPQVSIPLFAKVFVDRIMIEGRQTWLAPLILAMAVAFLIQFGLTWLRQSFLARLEIKLALVSSGKFFWHVLRLPTSFFTHHYAGDLSARVVSNDRIASLLSGELATAFVGLLTMVFFGAIMLLFDVTLTIVSVGVAILSTIVIVTTKRIRTDTSMKLAEDHARVLASTVFGVSVIETLKANGTEHDYFARWAGQEANAVNSRYRAGGIQIVVWAGPLLLISLSRITVLGLGSWQVMNGLLSVGDLIAYQLLSAQFFDPLARIIQMGQQIQEVSADIKRLEDVHQHPLDRQIVLTELDSSDDGPEDEREQQEPPSRVRRPSGYVELRDVTFGYSYFDPPLIEGFSLVLTPGRRVALVGSSGSGKSTIGKLIAGLLDPWSGSVLIDGKPRSAWKRDILSSSLAMVDQEISLYEGTIRENLTLWDETISEEAMVRASQDACIHDEIAGRQHGYDSHVEAGGRNFSGGQRQRLEIARALVVDPTMLVLDEATSALDPITEQRVNDRLRQRGSTSIIVAHRLSTIRDADEIILLERGRVVERGSHDELVARDGAYVELIKSD